MARRARLLSAILAASLLSSLPSSGQTDSGMPTACGDLELGSLPEGFQAILGSTGADDLPAPGFVRNESRTYVFVGGPGKDRITGTDGPDILCGGDGEDRLDGGEGDDLLLGDDAVLLDDQADRQAFKGAKDTLAGGAGDDVLVGEYFSGDCANVLLEGFGDPCAAEVAAADTPSVTGPLALGSAADVLDGGPGADTILGELLVGGAGNDKLSAAKDTFVVPAAGDCDDDSTEAPESCGDSIVGELLVDTRGGNDQFMGAGETIVAGPGRDQVIGDYVFSVGGAEKITLGGDRIDGGDGPDMIIGDGSVSSPLVDCAAEAAEVDCGTVGFGARTGLVDSLRQPGHPLATGLGNGLARLALPLLPQASHNNAVTDVKGGKDKIEGGEGSDTAIGDVIVPVGYGLAHPAAVGRFSIGGDSIQLGPGDNAGGAALQLVGGYNLGNTYKVANSRIMGGPGVDGQLIGQFWDSAGEGRVTYSGGSDDIQAREGASLAVGDFVRADGIHLGEGEADAAAAGTPLAEALSVGLLGEGSSMARTVRQALLPGIGAHAMALMQGNATANLKLGDDKVTVADCPAGDANCAGIGDFGMIDGYDGSTVKLGKDTVVAHQVIELVQVSASEGRPNKVVG